MVDKINPKLLKGTLFKGKKSNLFGESDFRFLGVESLPMMFSTWPILRIFTDIWYGVKPGIYEGYLNDSPNTPSAAGTWGTCISAN